METLVSRRNLDFVLFEMLDAVALTRLERFSGHDRETFSETLSLAERLARDVLAPCFAALDAAEPRFEGGRAMLPEATSAAVRALGAAGLFGAAQPADEGGMGLPRTIANAALLWLQAANVSVANYAMLTSGAVELLVAHGTTEQKARYARPMIEGRFLGTMALSEPQAGSSLGDITTVATPLGDGRYAIRGTKMWISGGEHEIADNIVHLMLARIAGAPPGIKGISLFIVPRRRLDDTGRPGEWNNVVLTGLNHKMGQRGTVNTVLAVGEGGETIGEIVGAPGEGLARMFTMMNEARIAVSMGAVGHASAGYLHSLAYARERLQGRAPDAKDPAAPQVPIVAHADVRRMLIAQKIAAEGGIALGLTLARLADEKAGGATPEDREEAGLLLDLLTPVFKAWVSEEALAANSHAMQVLGGAGYTRDHPLEQHWRDNRLNPIHEGTNGIQAIDLAGRKLDLAGGRALEVLVARMEATAARARATPEIAPMGEALAKAARQLAEAAEHVRTVGRTRGAAARLALAPDVMDLFGVTTCCWVWLEQARVASAALASAADGDRAFYVGKIAACAALFADRLPTLAPVIARLAEGRSSALDWQDRWF